MQKLIAGSSVQENCVWHTSYGGYTQNVISRSLYRLQAIETVCYNFKATASQTKIINEFFLLHRKQIVRSYIPEPNCINHLKEHWFSLNIFCTLHVRRTTCNCKQQGQYKRSRVPPKQGPYKRPRVPPKRASTWASALTVPQRLGVGAASRGIIFVLRSMKPNSKFMDSKSAERAWD